MVLFEAGFWERMMAVTQGCVSGALLFHKAVCSLKYSDEFCLMSSRQNSQKSNVMLEGSNNQNDCSCQHSGEVFNFVGSKLKARASGRLSGAWSFPCMGLKEDVAALELCAQHLSSKPGAVSKVHASTASPSWSRAAAELSYLPGLSLGCLVHHGAALLITRFHPVPCHITTIPKT